MEENKYQSFRTALTLVQSGNFTLSLALLLSLVLIGSTFLGAIEMFANLSGPT